MTALTLDALAEAPRWVAWRNENLSRGITKVPYSAPGRKALANKPTTWRTRAQAEAVARQVVNGIGGGIGLVLGEQDDGSHLAGIDLDTCRATDGTIEPWARDIIDRFGSYAEVSPSGTGVKLFFIVAAEDVAPLIAAMGTEHGRQWKGGKGEHPPAIELHVSNRYFTLTEQHLAETPLELVPVPLDQLLWLAQQVGPALAARPKKADAEKQRAGADESRSGIAFRKGAAIKRAGATFEQMIEALLDDPETADWTRTKGEANGQRELRRIWEKAGQREEEQADGDCRPPAFTDEALALHFAEQHRHSLRYVAAWGRWLIREPAVWRFDDTLRAFNFARLICRSAAAGCNKDNVARGLASAKTVAAVERLAKADRRHAATTDQWDADQWLLNTPGGVIDLRTGQMRAHRSDDYMTKITAVAPAAKPDCPLWLKFLDEATQCDADFIRFLQQWCGYSLTGDTSEHALLFVYGSGGNGKGVFVSTVGDIIGGYREIAAMDTFTASESDRHPADLAKLRGARMVVVSEVEEGRAWAEARIKQLTGGDRIAARFMRQDFFEFDPLFKLTITGNHRPVLRNVDEAARRRINMAPFIFEPPKKDTQLRDKLKAEWPGILRWMIDGCLDWQANGLVRPAVVTAATAEYFSEQDSIQLWIEDSCETNATVADTNKSLFASWRNYALSRGEAIGTQKWFAGTLQRLHFGRIKDECGIRGRGFQGIRVREFRQPDGCP